MHSTVRYRISAIKTALSHIGMALLVGGIMVAGAEEVGKFLFKGLPETINGKTVLMNEKIVAMNNYIKVGNPSNILFLSGSASIFIVIDNSASNTQQVSNVCMSDFNGERFKVSRAFIDTLNRLNPNVEVGLTAYSDDLNFRLSDDIIFKGIAGVANGYIPLLTLNKTYASSNSQLNNKTGYEILQYYLRTKDNSTNGGTDLAYGRYCGSGTNIDAGFNSCKDAMLTAKNPKASQFTLFFSDGIPNGGGDEWLTGKNVPTTFTFFLLPMNWLDAPPELYTMTNNIKNNGYSTTNVKTKMWSIKANTQDIMKLILKDMIPEIIKKITNMTPVTITANLQNPIGGWDNNGFLFKDLFPLTGAVTPFIYDIKYTLKRDSITQNGDTIHLPPKDTFVNINYSVEIRPGVTISDSFVVKLWGRNLGFYSKGSQVFSLNDTTKSIEVRFAKYPVDTLYDYQNVKITVSQRAGAVHDKEQFLLTDNGTFWAILFPLQEGNPAPGDNILQHARFDTIDALFRNPQLPLDTLLKSIVFSNAIVYTIDKAVYYDDDANGTVDRINVSWSQKVGVIAADLIISKLSLPAVRNFAVQTAGCAVNDNGIVLKVTDGSNPLHTGVAPTEVVTVTDTIVFSPICRVVPSSVPATDSAGAVIMTAQFVEGNGQGVNGKLNLTLSEDVLKCDHIEPFELCDRTGKVYRISCAYESTSGRNAVYQVTQYNDNRIPTYSDSIRINVIASYSDKVGILQKNPLNIRRPLSVVKSLQVTRAWYKDSEILPDGFINSVILETNVDLNDERAKALSQHVFLTKTRTISLTGAYAFTGKQVSLQTQESGAQNTAVNQSADTVGITQAQADSLTIYPQRLRAEDSLPPVAVKGYYAPGKYISETQHDPDYLTVYFSEKAQLVNAGSPFMFWDYAGKTTYSMDLADPNTMQGTEIRFRVVSSTKKFPLTGDSLWIKPVNNIKDMIGLSHKVDHKPAPLIVGDYDYNYRLVVIPNPYRAEKDLKNHLQKLADSLFRNDDAKNKNMDAHSMVFLGVPRGRVPAGITISATVTVVDALGNVIIKGQPVEFNPRNSHLYYVWKNLANVNGRPVGGGAYLLIFRINDNKTKPFKKMIGVTK